MEYNVIEVSRWDKAIDRLKSVPNDYQWSEVEYLFGKFGYKTNTSGGGSHFSFVNQGTGAVFRTVKPHKKGGKAFIKKYCIKEMIKHLSENGYI